MGRHARERALDCHTASVRAVELEGILASVSGRQPAHGAGAVQAERSA
jgi:hypothetical protein